MLKSNYSYIKNAKHSSQQRDRMLGGTTLINQRKTSYGSLLCPVTLVLRHVFTRKLQGRFHPDPAEISHPTIPSLWPFHKCTNPLLCLKSIIDNHATFPVILRHGLPFVKPLDCLTILISGYNILNTLTRIQNITDGSIMI